MILEAEVNRLHRLAAAGMWTVGLGVDDGKQARREGFITRERGHTMSRRLSLTERRRIRQAMKLGRLDRLETRNTITEPLSITTLSFTAFRGLAQLGIMQAVWGQAVGNTIFNAA
jgi:hypothetical protein